MSIIRRQGKIGKSREIAQIMLTNKRAICLQPTDMDKNSFCRRFAISPKRVFTAGEVDKIPPNRIAYINGLERFLSVLLGEEK